MKTDVNTGLSNAEVRSRQSKFGKNELVKEHSNIMTRFLRKLIAPIPLMIEVALVLSALAERWEDFWIIFVLLSINIGIDFFQEERAGRALQALRNTLARTALVKRDGVYTELPAADLVPGDIVKLTIGSIVPADVVLREGEYVEIDQSALTGESLSVTKHIGDEVFGNSIVREGEMISEVTKTGAYTFIGQNSQLVKNAVETEESHFQKAIIRIGNFLIAFSLVVVAIIVVVSLLRGNSLLETIRFALVVTIASVPVALPAVLSVTMAVGATAIAKKNAIVTNLKSIEELAGVDILCTDKTGTLTKNKMTVATPELFNDTDEAYLFQLALLASSQENHDPIEMPLFVYAQENGYTTGLEQYQRDKFVPFDPNKKYTKAVVHDQTNESIVIMKGAAQVVAKWVDETEPINRLQQLVEQYAQKGYRTLVVASKQGENKIILRGLIPLFDPPRDDSKTVINLVKRAGISIKMLTGDAMAIAKHIAALLEIGIKIRNTKLLKQAELTKGDDDDLKIVMEADGFAQVTPQDKYALVEILQHHNHIVAMTGDGVNDAPALQKADIGIAVLGATDAARSASDLILLSPGLLVIRDTLTTARQTFSRMQSYATFRIAETIRIILFIALSILLFDSFPLTAVMIIVLALLNDIPVMTIAYDNAPTHNQPVRWNMRETLFITSILGIAGVISSFSLFYWLHVNGFSLAILQTLIFLKLDVAGHSTLYLTRTGRNHFWHRPFPSWKFFLPAFGSRLVGTLIAVYGLFMKPIGWKMAGYIWLYAIVWWLCNDWIKVWAYQFYDAYLKKRQQPTVNLGVS